tara:strand:+ start:1944 stop:2396 length:453 start_codon:yes stop_codon:yes gene_type:complete
MMGWKEIMKIPGTTKVQLLLLTILMISSVSSTGLLIYNLVSNTSEENISPKNVSLEVVRDGLRLRVTGSDTMEVLNELSADRKLLGNSAFKREILSLHSRLGDVNYEETKQLFLNNVLVEALDDGTPAYYNSNILGRYMRKDYGDFRTDT